MNSAPPKPALLPQPQRVSLAQAFFSPASAIDLVSNRPLSPVTVEVYKSALTTIGATELRPSSDAAGKSKHAIFVSLDSECITTGQGYRLRIAPSRIEVEAAEEAGAFYAAMTLKQLARLYADSQRLPCLQIEDWPDFAARGIMLDISRDKVPTMKTLFDLVDMLSEWKINQLQLYTEHTFAYREHPQVWRDASPMTGDEMQQLDTYCRERFIELAPNQNSFGHMERWLRHEKYAHLAASPAGFVKDGRHRPPTTLNPLDPQTLELIAGLYEELLPHFASRKFNVGCDETFDLCLDKCRAACQEKGAGQVYLEFLLQIHRLVKSHERTMMFWGDIIHEHPELIPELPKDLIALEWGYRIGHPFEEHCARFEEVGVPFYICPGTSSWNSLIGRSDVFLSNMRAAAENGLKYGAEGYLVTDWGDNGHLQFLPVSFAGYAFGAAQSWSAQANPADELAEKLDRHVFFDSANVMGQFVLDLGRTYRLGDGTIPLNSTVPGHILSYPHEFSQHLQGETPSGVRRMQSHLQQTLSRLAQSRMQRDDSVLIQEEFKVNASLFAHLLRLVQLALEDGAKSIAGLPEKSRRELSRELNALIPEYRRLWLARNRPGGLSDSAGRLERLLSFYEAKA